MSMNKKDYYSAIIDSQNEAGRADKQWNSRFRHALMLHGLGLVPKTPAYSQPRVSYYVLAPMPFGTCDAWPTSFMEPIYETVS